MNQDNRSVRVGVIGLGFMGATHVRAYQAAHAAGFRCELVAVCDRKESRRRGLLGDVAGNIPGAESQRDEVRAFDTKVVRSYAHVDEILRDAAIDLVSICTQTDTHADVAIAALEAGKHVLVEKPVALSAADIRRVRDAAKRSKKLCMPAMCMRFWPGWSWLKERIDHRTFGRCLGVTFQRLGSAPSWSGAFYKDPSRSGGALVDLHIHDADFVRFCFGSPHSVNSFGSAHAGAINHLTTAYRFTEGPVHVVAEGGWLTPDFGFRMRYIAVFEHATVDFDLTRKDPLLLCHAGKCEAVEMESLSGYDLEIRHLVDAIVSGKAELKATLDDAIAVAELLDAEKKSIETGKPVLL